MIKIKKIIAITSVLAVSIGSLVAQGYELYGGGTAGSGMRNGTAGASQLLIPQGAKYLTGGGAVAMPLVLVQLTGILLVLHVLVLVLKQRFLTVPTLRICP